MEKVGDGGMEEGGEEEGRRDGIEAGPTRVERLCVGMRSCWCTMESVSGAVQISRGDVEGTGNE